MADDLLPSPRRTGRLIALTPKPAPVERQSEESERMARLARNINAVVYSADAFFSARAARLAAQATLRVKPDRRGKK